jgi:ribosomal protein L7/L12
LEVDPPTYTLRLVSLGDDRLRVMSAIRALRPELGLAAAKALVEPLRQVVKADVPHVDVECVRSRFQEIGAVVEFVDNFYGRIR